MAGLLWIFGADLLHMKNADVRMSCPGSLFFPIQDRMVNTPFHVRLSAANPYFSQHHIFQFNLMLPMILMVCGPPAPMVFMVVFQADIWSAFTFTVSVLFQLVIIFTVAPASDQPQIATSAFCCKTMLSENTEGKMILAEMPVVKTTSANREKTIFFHIKKFMVFWS